MLSLHTTLLFSIALFYQLNQVYNVIPQSSIDTQHMKECIFVTPKQLVVEMYTVFFKRLTVLVCISCQISQNHNAHPRNATGMVGVIHGCVVECMLR